MYDPSYFSLHTVSAEKPGRIIKDITIGSNGTPQKAEMPCGDYKLTY